MGKFYTRFQTGGAKTIPLGAAYSYMVDIKEKTPPPGTGIRALALSGRVKPFESFGVEREEKRTHWSHSEVEIEEKRTMLHLRAILKGNVHFPVRKLKFSFKITKTSEYEITTT